MSSLDFTPNTPEWEEMRKDKIGASDAPIIMGVSPYSTPYQLWQKKLGLLEEAQNFAMARGHSLESQARAQVEERLGISLVPQVKTHNSLDWMMATLDGLSIDGKTLVEIKCPGVADHGEALQGRIPEKYFPQVQHQLEVCEIEKGYYFSFDGKEGVLLEFYRDDKYIKKLITIEKEFYLCMQDLNPPALTERDYQIIESPQWLDAATKWKQISAQLTSLEKEEETLRQQLISLCGNQSSAGGGVKVGKYSRKGSIDYAKIPQLHNVNLEKYRKKTIECWKIVEAK